MERKNQDRIDPALREMVLRKTRRACGGLLIICVPLGILTLLQAQTTEKITAGIALLVAAAAAIVALAVPTTLPWRYLVLLLGILLFVVGIIFLALSP